MFDLLPHINVAYPPNNEIIFEEWFREVYRGCKTDRGLLPINFTSYWVNNDYGNNEAAKKYLQEFVDGLDRNKKYFCIVQYDDGVLIDFKDLDVVQFNMSKKVGIEIPLLCQPHPYKFDGEKKYLASFVGSRTHPIRNELEKLKGKEGYHISFEPHEIEDYCRIIHESYFVLCPRGYGASSFRICESLQYGAIPVYLSDEFIEPFGVPFNYYGVRVDDGNIHKLEDWLNPDNRNDGYLHKNKQIFYEEMFTYEGCSKQIIKNLETEYRTRQDSISFSANGRGTKAAADF